MNTKQVADRLSEVYDPDLGLNIIDLGLVYGINVDDDAVSVVMTMTSPGCPFSDLIAESAREVLLRPPGSTNVSVRLVHEPPWDPQMMELSARRRLGLA